MKIRILGTDEYEDAKMFVDYRGRTYTADTAIDLIDKIKGDDWDAKFSTTGTAAEMDAIDAERYIEIKLDYKKPWNDSKIELPDGDTEARAIAMFKAIHDLGGWHFEMEE